MIGLIFGDTNFPNEILKKIKNLTQFLLVKLVKLLIFLKKIIVKKYYLREK